MKEYKTYVAGVTFKNDDGSPRQEILSSCKSGDIVTLVPEPGNKFSKNAIKVCRADGKQIGYVPDYIAKSLCEALDEGKTISASIGTILGMTPDKPNLGCRIVIEREE